jgi:hypothetical protein
MKNIVFIFCLFITNSFCASAQYNYQNGLLNVNGINYKVGKTNTAIFFQNNQNYVGNTPMTHPPDISMCGFADFDKSSTLKINDVFRQVLPSNRRVLFDNRKSLGLTITASSSGQILEVEFMFDQTSPITPQELSQIEVGLKALTDLKFKYNKNCTGVNYRSSSTEIYIHEL